MLKSEWIKQGFIDEPVTENVDLKTEIRRLAKEKDAIILAHYYTIGDIQDVADFVGDSLALARKAAETDAKMMVKKCFCLEGYRYGFERKVEIKRL